MSADEGRVAVTGGEVWWQKVAGGSGVPLPDVYWRTVREFLASTGA